MKRAENTRSALINAAGELFAEHGFEGVGTRMIAARAEVKLSAIHYHFGSKEKLYIATCLAAYANAHSTTFAEVVRANPRLMEQPEGQAEIVRSTIFGKFHEHFRPDRPPWEARILLREIASPTIAMPALVQTIYRPESESAAAFYRTIRPKATAEEAAAWSDLMYGQILLYSMAGKTIEMVRGENCLNERYYHTAAVKLARAMILEAGLPLPPELMMYSV